MKTTFTAEAPFKDAPSKTNAKPPNGKLGNLTVTRPLSMGYSRLAQSGRGPVQGSDESVFMKSQLG